ncbi:alpha/beta hydrolase family protein [Pseudoteredinibacter isoporae]|uniref:Dipeptidyl aminopeptidase/acylaminoacyl peptidase n=1 Tax=Pseudoteredinibacter isoporae TaxID=570281 RepID=A0A7X0JSI0_9GAMM|nr:alpha/beta fold hydrolase [Pseudoteredinibacter isoporae]MBB6521054.1 dipeptidyl aminopeptidase/acylaminoacyl peptidase [Pseudoteredinibacter isoporae]NHO86618.1 S9 family peptidase [Pseudoteredinibacter isoporae]NIB24930.1 S9 family peptidase [Pseudoteredinibacter isoporae]
MPSYALRILVSLLIFALCTLGSNSLIAKTVTDSEIAHFVKKGDYLDVKISPDGSSLAARVRQGDDMLLMFVDIATGKPSGAIKASNGDIVYNYYWANNERVVYQFAKKVSSLDVPVSFGMWAINKDNTRRKLIYGHGVDKGKTGTRLNQKQEIKAAVEFISPLMDDPKNILIVEHPLSRIGNYLHDLRNIAPSISKLNVYSGKRYKVETLPTPGADPVASRLGELNVYTNERKNTQLEVFYRQKKGEDWRQASLPSAYADPRVVGVSEDGKEVFVRARDAQNGFRTLYSWSPDAGEIVQLFETEWGDVSDWMVDPVSNSPIAAIHEPDLPKYQYLEKPYASFHKMLARAFKGQRVSFADHSFDGRYIVAFVDSDVNPGEYYLFDTQTKKADFLMAARSWIDPNTMRPVKTVEVEARDGLMLNGYLTVANSNEIKAPLVVLPHGGPHGVREYWEYDSEAQLLAYSGFNVLQIDFRGSGGRGSKFETAGYRNWGKSMVEDVIDATNAMVKEGYADADKVCIYGASYGGFSSLMAAVKAPDLYQCAVGYVGVYDLNMMFESGDIPEMRIGPGFLKKVLGSDKAAMAAQSPVNNAEKIKANVLLIHGEEDRRAPIEQGEAMKSALERAGNKPKWIVFGRSGHGVWDNKDRVKLYKELIGFLNQHIGSS